MPKFLAVHSFPSLPTFAEAMPIAKMAKAGSTVDAYWVRSYAQLNEEGKLMKLYCEWNAKNIETIRKVLADLPIQTEGVYPLTIVDSEDFR
jgi:hypothetical protein